MRGIPSLTGEAYVNAEGWTAMFEQRGVWHSTRDIVEHWIARKVVFFDMPRRPVPRGSIILGMGCGPGRHALAEAMPGYDLIGIDVDRLIVLQAQANARSMALDGELTFRLGNMFDLNALAPPGAFETITDVGFMKHLDATTSIRDALCARLEFTAAVIFDIAVDAPKNRRLFAQDDLSGSSAHLRRGCTMPWQDYRSSKQI